MALGLIDAGFDVKLAFDIDPKAIETYRLNISNHASIRDIRNVNGSALLTELGLSELDLLSGGPPCQGFSKQKRGAHLALDARNDLVREYVRLVEEASPKVFVFENVQIFGQKRGELLLNFLERKLDAYQIHRFFVYASDFGLAQRRSRFILIGVRRDISNDIPVLGMAEDEVTVRDVIGDLPAPPEDGSEHPQIANHIKCKITPLNEERFRHVPPGGGWQSIPKSIRLSCHNGVDQSKGGWPDVYGRLEWDGQCPTITSGFDSFTRGRYGHPEQHRALTLREGARLQGFPDYFRFIGTRHDIRLQIGNAVPPPLGAAIGRAVRRILGQDATLPRAPLYPEGINKMMQAAE